MIQYFGLGLISAQAQFFCFTDYTYCTKPPEEESLDTKDIFSFCCVFF